MDPIKAAKWIALVIGAILALVAVLEVLPYPQPVTLPTEPPPFFVVNPSFPPRELIQGPTHTKSGVVFDDALDDSRSLGLEIYNYKLVVFEKLFGYQQYPPTASMLNFELGIKSQKLAGIGLGADAIQCGDGQPDSCISWVYWTHVGRQLIQVSLFNERGAEPVTPDAFRQMVRSLLNQS